MDSRGCVLHWSGQSFSSAPCLKPSVEPRWTLAGWQETERMLSFIDRTYNGWVIAAIENEMLYFKNTNNFQQFWPLRTHQLSIPSGLLCVFYSSLASALSDILNILHVFKNSASKMFSYQGYASRWFRWNTFVVLATIPLYLVDISKRSLTELTLQPVAPHLSSSCSQSEADSYQFMWVSRRRLLRNCFISGGRKWFKHFMSCISCVKSANVVLMLMTLLETRPDTVYDDMIYFLMLFYINITYSFWQNRLSTLF